MKNDKQQALCNIRNYRRHERLVFHQCIESHGVDGRALMHLDNLTNSHRDEHTIQKTQSSNEINEINRLYRPENE